ncbi:kinase-like domain-containing protein [Leucosporidium creatinivorum]|uniref:Kinase-like domain-containing protein n=1 Tax=Leucosporidium creatinivorum TaxID=106004 RepID=A0A1Y2G040_9BASI|nr:kinase-like domain-containing protein [Leucosporidium creatinivorum]
MSAKAVPRARPEAQRPTTSARRGAPYPAATNRASYNSRQAPASTYYSVEQLQNGQEVITIEDTPTPEPGAAAAGALASGSGARYEGYGGAAAEPAAKRRKSDGAHISDNPYVASSSSSSRAKQPPPAYHANNANGAASGSTSKNKRKHGHDPYEDYSDRSSDRAHSGQRPSQKARPAEEEQVCDKEGHFIVRPGAVVGNFTINKLLGQGTFGKVVSATRAVDKGKFAVKIIRNVPKYREASRVEHRVLEMLKREDPTNQFKCIPLIDHFEHVGHVCFATPLLGPSVFDFLKENQYSPFPYSHVQSFARQLLTSVGFVHRKRYVHTDLKPENILLQNTASDVLLDKDTKKSRKVLRDTTIHLIDFGSATRDDDYHATVVSTRHYRAPEIILGLGWDHRCDLWSIGCILVEFVTGEALFQTHENLEHLAMMEKVFGKMPSTYAEAAYKKAENTERAPWFNPPAGRGGKPTLHFPQTATTSKQSKKFVMSMKPLQKIIGDTGEVTKSRFCNLLEGLLKWRAEDRITIDEALSHPFFALLPDDDGKNSLMPKCPPLPPFKPERPPYVSRR